MSQNTPISSVKTDQGIALLANLTTKRSSPMKSPKINQFQSVNI